MKIMPSNHPYAMQVKTLRSKINYHYNMSLVAPTSEVRSISARHADAFRIELAVVELRQQQHQASRRRIVHSTHIPAMIMRDAGMTP